MSMQRKTITVIEQMESLIKTEADSGKYPNDSEYFRDMLCTTSALVPLPSSEPLLLLAPAHSRTQLGAQPNQLQTALAGPLRGPVSSTVALPLAICASYVIGVRSNNVNNY